MDCIRNLYSQSKHAYSHDWWFELGVHCGARTMVGVKQSDGHFVRFAILVPELELSRIPIRYSLLPDELRQYM